MNLFQEGSCFNCGGSPVIFRRHSGQYLCFDCFKNSLEAIIRKTISTYKLLSPNDKILVAFSGGISSTTLLYNLKNVQQRVYHGKPISAMTIQTRLNHENLQRAKDFCEKHSIEHLFIPSDELNSNINMKLRYDKYELIRTMLNYMNDLDFNVLCVGFNLTDIAEICLSHLLKESKIFKIEKNSKIRVIFPLMRIPEQEILTYSKLQNFEIKIHSDKYINIDNVVHNFLDYCSKKSPEIEFNLFKVYLELSRIGFFDQIMPKLF